MVFQEKRRIFAPYLKSLGMQENKDDIIYWYVLGSLSTHKELIIRGVCHYPDGDAYEGEWENDNPNGYGEYLTAEGKKYIGLFENGKYVDMGYMPPFD